MAGPASTTAVQKTYKDETITLYGRMLIGATNTQPTLITANGASKGFISAALFQTGPSVSRYEFALDPSIRVVNILGFSLNLIRSPTNGLSAGPILQVHDYSLGTPTTGAKVVARTASILGSSLQLPPNSTLELTLVITTSNIL